MLWAPVMYKYRRDKIGPWVQGPNYAQCLCEGTDHIAPDVDCSCGIRATVDLEPLLKSVSQRFAGSDLTILDEAGALARVELRGKVIEGDATDPATTWRGSQARLLDVHVLPTYAEHVETLHAAYNVPVGVYSGEGWQPPTLPEPKSREDRFIDALAKIRFGTVDVRKHRDAMLSVAADVQKAIEDGITTGDIIAVLYRSRVRPSVPQVRKFIELTIEHICPHLVGYGIRDGYEHAPPVRQSEALIRQLLR